MTDGETLAVGRDPVIPELRLWESDFLDASSFRPLGSPQVALFQKWVHPETLPGVSSAGLSSRRYPPMAKTDNEKSRRRSIRVCPSQGQIEGSAQFPG